LIIKRTGAGVIYSWLGFIGKPVVNVFEGETGKKGFALRILGSSGGIFATPGSGIKKMKNSDFKGVFRITGALMVLALILYFISPPLFWLFLLVVLGLNWIIFINIVMIRKIFHGETAEWHACEHKSYILLRSGLGITTENMKKCPRSLYNCGGSVYANIVQFATLLIGVGAGLSMPTPENLVWRLLYGISLAAIIVLFLSSSILLLLQYFGVRRMILPSEAELFWYMVWPGSVFPRWFDHYVATKEPSEEKYIQSVIFLNGLLTKQ
jgi:hypothetical protein